MMCLFINTNAQASCLLYPWQQSLLNKYCFVCGCEQQFILQGLFKKTQGKKKNKTKLMLEF